MGLKNSLAGLCGSYHPIHRAWPRKARRANAWLMGCELIGIVPALVIFGIAQPDLYRSDMWQIGYDHRLNSNPNMILYAYANHRPLPDIPLVWSRKLTDFNVAISIISLFFLLCRLIMHIMKCWYPLLGLCVNTALVALYATSTYGQVGPDYADDRYPAYAAWYLRKGCDLAKPYGKLQNCRIAQGSLVISVYLLALYTVCLGFTVWAMWPNKANDIEYDSDEEEDDSVMPAVSGPVKPSIVEMRSLHTPGFAQSDSPFTPRTTAFHTLNRDLPLRQQYG